MKKYTPGPWKYVEDHRAVVDSSNTLVQISGISVPCGYVPPSHFSYANARLIAAAPDLLEACKAAWDEQISRTALDEDLMAILEAAIEKATGGAA